MLKSIRIGTRDSQLALWQARFVEEQLVRQGYACELVLIKSEGDLNVRVPLYEMGVQGIFTKTLDTALLNHTIDLAVHSLKDVPTQPAVGITLAAVLERGNPYDVFVFKDQLPDPNDTAIIATSSLRRAAQWRYRFPKHQTTPLRGNINSRLQKLLDNSNWEGAIFAAAGIERIQLPVPHQIILDWMIPAPAQGALCIAVRSDDMRLQDICAPLNHLNTALATGIERDFLRQMMGGCSMPIGALVTSTDNGLRLRACIGTVDGQQMAFIDLSGPLNQALELPYIAVEAIHQQGAKAILESFPNR
jgi:hydroxymethylbilane synthase